MVFEKGHAPHKRFGFTTSINLPLDEELRKGLENLSVRWKTAKTIVCRIALAKLLEENQNDSRMDQEKTGN